MGNRKGTAVFWVQLTMVGALLLALTTLVCLLRVPLMPLQGTSPLDHLWTHRLRMIALLPSVLGVLVMVWAERRFNRGFQNDLWTEAELAEVRRLVDRRIWTGIGIVLFVVWTAALFFERSLLDGGLACLVVVPAQTAQRLRVLITPRVERSAGLANWRHFGPLRSEHWGESGV